MCGPDLGVDWPGVVCMHENQYERQVRQGLAAAPASKCKNEAGEDLVGLFGEDLIRPQHMYA